MNNVVTARILSPNNPVGLPQAVRIRNRASFSPYCSWQPIGSPCASAWSRPPSLRRGSTLVCSAASNLGTRFQCWSFDVLPCASTTPCSYSRSGLERACLAVLPAHHSRTKNVLILELRRWSAHLPVPIQSSITAFRTPLRRPVFVPARGGRNASCTYSGHGHGHA